VEFWKAPPANVTVRLMPRVCWIGGIRSCALMLLFRPFGSGGSGAQLCSVLPSDNFLVQGEIRGGEYHESRIGGLAMEVRVSAILRDMLGILALAATQVKFTVLSFRVIIQGLPLIGCVWQWSC
jgi:hypothetical protein